MDALCPAASLDRAVRVSSMDEVLGVDPEYPTHDLTFHDMLSSGGESADITAGRKIDWDEALLQMDDRQRGVIEGTAAGTPHNFREATGCPSSGMPESGELRWRPL